MGVVSSSEFGSTLETVGHHVHKCSDATACSKAVAEGHFDVVLADPSDAAQLKASGAKPSVVPVLMKPSKEDLARAKTEYGQAFDASRGSLRLLPVLNTASKTGSSAKSGAEKTNP